MKCTSKDTKFNHLTIGKDYPDAKTTGEFVELTNDIGVKARYHKRYFNENDEKVAAPATRRAAQRPPERRILTIEDIISRINITITNDNSEANICILSYAIGNNRENTLFFDRTPNSCGVAYVDGINNLREYIDDILDGDFLGINEDFHTSITESILFNAILKRIIRSFSNDHSFAFLILSTNDPDSTIFEDFTNAAGVTKSFNTVNPNSQNLISVWIIDINEYINH